MNEPALPVAVARRGISEDQWRTLMNNLYPGASGESVLMVWDYCQARKLDPLKKPCHIVPMQVKQGADYVWRDVVLPGIYEYRTTAHRTGQYLGHTIPSYGPAIESKGVTAPEYCDFTVFRWNPISSQRGEYPVRVMFNEVVATKKDGTANARWSKAPLQMLTKCAEAAALREAFPDEFGGVPTMEEMEGQTIDVHTDLGPRSDTSEVSLTMVDRWIGDIKEILEADETEYAIADKLREANAELSRLPELFQVVYDQLAKRKIISKANYRAYLDIYEPEHSAPATDAAAASN